MEEIGRRRGALRAGGRVDLHKVSEILLHELRQGTPRSNYTRVARDDHSRTD